MVAEAVGGWLTGSLALLADAGHMLSDVAALGLSLFAMWMARRPPTSKRTYGYHRMEILAALANGATLVAISILVLIEAVQRFRNPPEVDAPGDDGDRRRRPARQPGGARGSCTRGVDENLNVRGAWLHVLTDALGSVQAIAAGALIWAFGWRWADPAASVLIALAGRLLLLVLLKEATARADGERPGAHRRGRGAGRSIADCRESWRSTTCTSGRSPAAWSPSPPTWWWRTRRYDCELLGEIRTTLHDRFGIDHITMQMETEAFVEHRREGVGPGS